MEWDGLVPAEPGWFLIGAGENGAQLGWDLTHAPHMLATGATGTGKTSMILGVVVQAVAAGYLVRADQAVRAADREIGRLGWAHALRRRRLPATCEATLRAAGPAGR